MNQSILSKLLVGAILLFSNYKLNCMELSSTQKASNSDNDGDSEKFEFMIDSEELAKIEAEIYDNRNIFVPAERLITKLESMQGGSGDTNVDKITKLIEKFAKLFIEKIVQDKLKEYQETDEIALLFNAGIRFSEKIKFSEIQTNYGDENENYTLASLPNELLLAILIKGIDDCFDLIDPINTDEVEKPNKFLRNPLSLLQPEENKQQKTRNALNAQLLSATCGAINFIASVMGVNKCFYLFAEELINHLKAKISYELLHEKILESIANQKSFGLLILMLKANKIDVNYSCKRRGRKETNLLSLLIGQAKLMRKTGSSVSEIEQVIKIVLDQNANLINDHSRFLMFIRLIHNKEEDLAIFLLQKAPDMARAEMARDKVSLHSALRNDMQQLVNVMIENGAIIKSTDLEELENYKKRRTSNQTKRNLDQTKESNWCTIS